MAYQFTQTGAEIQGILNNAEDKTNKVTSISASSTNSQYPTAKLMWDMSVQASAQLNGKADKATNSLNYKIGRDANGYYFEIEG